VPDEIWEEARRHYDERALAGLIIAIATINALAWARPAEPDDGFP
jgi:hypothetical protein